MTTEQRLDNIENLLKQILTTKQKPVEINGREVIRLTGWSAEKLRQMRDMGAVKFRRYGKQIRYDLNSIPTQYIKP